MPRKNRKTLAAAPPAPVDAPAIIAAAITTDVTPTPDVTPTTDATPPARPPHVRPSCFSMSNGARNGAVTPDAPTLPRNASPAAYLARYGFHADALTFDNGYLNPAPLSHVSASAPTLDPNVNGFAARPVAPARRPAATRYALSVLDSACAMLDRNPDHSLRLADARAFIVPADGFDLYHGAAALFTLTRYGASSHHDTTRTGPGDVFAGILRGVSRMLGRPAPAGLGTCANIRPAVYTMRAEIADLVAHMSA